jgi:hypothetical protein
MEPTQSICVASHAASVTVYRIQTKVQAKGSRAVNSSRAYAMPKPSKGTHIKKRFGL